MSKFIQSTVSLLTAATLLGLAACQNTAVNPGSGSSSGTVDESPAVTTSPKEEETTLDKTLESKHRLSFNKEGEFKILVLSDVHGQGEKLVAETKANIRLLVERENPDLVIFDGDNTFGIKSLQTIKSCVADMVEPIEEKGIPWMHVYGNHDDEYGAPSKKKQQAVYESFAYCISKTGENLTGVGNYVVPIYASDGDKVAFAVWALDSGTYLSDREKKELFGSNSFYPGHPNSDYGYIHPDQIAWYYETSKLLQEQNGGRVVPGLMAFHIALQESYYAWQNRDALTYTGERREDVCASAVNSGLFSVLCERGDIKAVVNGHDHVNDFMVECCGIKLCQASTPTAENIYHDDDILGGRVFVIKEQNPAALTTYLSYVHKKQEAPDYSDAEKLPSGAGCDFESEAPEFDARGFDNNRSEGAHVDEIVTTVKDGVGAGGSRGLALTREKWYGDNTGNNAELTFSADGYGRLGDNRYLRVWVDLGTGNIDFRKAGFGLVVNGGSTRPYRTDDYDKKSPFYYLAEGSDEWLTYSCGSDGCFGKGDGQSVKGFRGWLAFPIEYMVSSGNRLTADSVITGYYFYFCLASSEMAGSEFYLDNLTLTADYTVFEQN